MKFDVVPGGGAKEKEWNFHREGRRPNCQQRRPEQSHWGRGVCPEFARSIFSRVVAQIAVLGVRTFQLNTKTSHTLHLTQI
jgi:hypothetical protein